MNKDYERLKKWRADNPEKVTAQNKRRYAKMKANGDTRHERSKLDHYIIYYLPLEHYVGITNNPNYRMSGHRKHGKDTTGWRVLQTTKTKHEAKYIEALFASVLAINGL